MTEINKESKEEKDLNQAIFSAPHPDRRIPKYCNGIHFHKLSDGSIVLTFVLKETVQMKLGDPTIEENIIIDKIIVDAEHAKSIAEKLSNLTQNNE